MTNAHLFRKMAALDTMLLRATLPTCGVIDTDDYDCTPAPAEMHRDVVTSRVIDGKTVKLVSVRAIPTQRLQVVR